MVEKVIVPSEDTGQTLEEEAAALDTAAKVPPKEPELAGEKRAVERPAWLPEKFKTPEDMAKAYSELEKSNGKAPDGEGEPKDTEQEADKAVEAAGLDMAALSDEYADKGELAPESLEALAKIGITGDMVKDYIAGNAAQADAMRNTLLEPVGGEEGYSAMIAWASDNLDDAAVDAFNSVIEGGDINATKMAVENLNTKFVAANGSEPARQLDGKPPNSSLAVYESTADLMKDMNNPEYKTNSAFRTKVEAKLGRSSIM